MSSAYLSPIASSGDSTPQNEEQQLINPKNSNNDAKGEQELAKSRLFKEQQESKLINSLKQQQHLQQIDRLRGGSSVFNDDDDDDDDDDYHYQGRSELEAAEEEFDYELNNQRLRLNKQTAPAESSKTSDNNNQARQLQQTQQQQTSPSGQFGLNLKSQLMENCSKTGSQLHHLFQSATCNQLIRTNTKPNFEKSAESKAPKQLINGKKLRHLLQSIPLVPIVATSIMTLFIVCIILLSDSLQLATATSSSSLSPVSSSPSSVGAAAPPSSLRVGQHRRHHNNNHRHHSIDSNNQELEAQPLIMDRQGLVEELVEKQRREALDGDYPGGLGAEFAGSGGGGGDGLADSLPGTKSALKRELIEGLLGGNQRHHQSLPSSSLSSSSMTPTNNNHRHPTNQQDNLDQSAGPHQFDSLGAMLMSAGAAEAGVAPVEGRDEPALALAERELESGSASVRPAHLRSSALELDLSGEPNPQKFAGATKNSPNYEQEVDHQNNDVASHPLRLTSNNNYNNHHLNRHQPHRNQQQQQPLQPADDQQPNRNFGHHERPFDVPQIQCNNTEEGFERFACPTADELGRYRCIEDRLFCDGYYDCPGGEDENQVSCMYYKLKQTRQGATHHH